MTSPLHSFLAPESIAVIGASNDPTKRGYKAICGLLAGGYEGAIYPINPRGGETLGLRTWTSLAAVSAEVDLALICTPAHSVPMLIRQCGACGVKGAVVLASGFAEADASGAGLERQLVDAAQSAGVRVVGPNTSGLFNLHKKVNLLGIDNVHPGGVGIISQSGNMLLALALEAEKKGHIGFSTYVGPGNQSDVDFADYLQYLGDDPDTRVATFYVEGFGDGRRFLDVARQVSRHKPVVVYKSGSTAEGQRAASSHTGSLAGSYRMTVDLLRQSGVSVVDQSDDILPVAEGLSLLQKADGTRVAVLADGGGQATIASDRLSEAGLQLAPLNPQTREALAAILLPQASLANPVDVAGSSDASPQVLAECMDILAADDNVDMVLLVGMFGGYGIRFAEELKPAELQAADAIIRLASETSKPLLVYSLYAPTAPAPLKRLREAGIPVYSSIEHAVQVLAALGMRGNYIRRSGASAPSPQILTQEHPQIAALFSEARNAGRDLYEYEAKSLLRICGIDIPPQPVIRSEKDIPGIVRQLGNQPLAMKVVSRDILHKSDAGGVKLNLSGTEALREARQEILGNCRNYNPDADIEGLLVTPMAPKGVEVIIGVSRDPIFGPVLMFGLGGIFVEILEDVAFRSIPVSREQAGLMIDQIRACKILDGARGEAAVDKQALIELLLRVSAIVEACPQIAELDLNPTIVSPDGYTIVDARIIIDRHPDDEGESL